MVFQSAHNYKIAGSNPSKKILAELFNATYSTKLAVFFVAKSYACSRPTKKTPFLLLEFITEKI